MIAEKAIYTVQRQFAVEPIVYPNRQGFGAEALFRAGWDDSSSSDPTVTSRIMLDNWLVYGLDELIGRSAVFVNCTRETLISGFHLLLPHSAVFEPQESVEPDAEVLGVLPSVEDRGLSVRAR
jgi:c-di-GMP-related signal transduction protein